MLLVVPFILAALVAVPVAAADPILVLSYTPNGVEPHDAPRYYLKATLSPPDAPRRNESYANDCAKERPSDPGAGAARVVMPLLRIDPRSGTFSDWFPSCVAVPLGAPGADGTPGPSFGYASYNVSSGRYYAELPPWTPLVAATTSSSASSGHTGTTGAALSADCVGCPPPTCC